MKNKLGNYTFNKLEIRILKEVTRGKHTFSEIKEALKIKPSLLSYNIKKLSQKGLIKKIKKGSKRNVYFDSTKHASLFRELLSIYDHVKWENILLGLAIEVLFEVLKNSKTSFRNFSKVTFWRHVRNMKAHGLLEPNYNGYGINPRFSLLENFLIEYQRFLMNNLVRSVSDRAVILWRKDFECLIRIPKDLNFLQKNFFRTATSRFNDFDIPILSEFDICFYSKNKKIMRVEDLILHTLLIDRDNVRYSLYSLLMMKKKWKRINKEYLLREAQKFDLSLQINAMFEFLRTKGVRKGLTLPSWEEFIIKAKQYKVED